MSECLVYWQRILPLVDAIMRVLREVLPVPAAPAPDLLANRASDVDFIFGSCSGVLFVLVILISPKGPLSTKGLSAHDLEMVHGLHKTEP